MSIKSENVSRLLFGAQAVISLSSVSCYLFPYIELHNLRSITGTNLPFLNYLFIC
jgi:hypothetical protein